jgi:hypothetical protein
MIYVDLKEYIDIILNLNSIIYNQFWLIIFKFKFKFKIKFKFKFKFECKFKFKLKLIKLIINLIIKDNNSYYYEIIISKIKLNERKIKKEINNL